MGEGWGGGMGVKLSIGHKAVAKSLMGVCLLWQPLQRRAVVRKATTFAISFYKVKVFTLR